MFVGKDGRVGGSIDRAHVVELYRQTDDAELKAYYRDLLGESEEGKALDEPPEAEVEAEDEQPPKASMAQSKDELIAQAEAAGIETEGKTKAELVQALGGEA